MRGEEEVPKNRDVASSIGSHDKIGMSQTPSVDKKVNKFQDNTEFGVKSIQSRPY